VLRALVADMGDIVYLSAEQVHVCHTSNQYLVDLAGRTRDQIRSRVFRASSSAAREPQQGEGDSARRRRLRGVRPIAADSRSIARRQVRRFRGSWD
jgi:hypothetical protein